MLVPAKHISRSESLLGFGAIILSLLKKPMSLDSLWIAYQKYCRRNKGTHIHTFDYMLLALSFLYSLGVIIETEGILEKK